MENVPSALVGRVPASSPLDRLQLTARTMANPTSVSISAAPPQIVAVDTKPEKTPHSPGFTLRVKPDRRRAQVPIPAELDRRHPR
jgi:hypothetical protein